MEQLYRWVKASERLPESGRDVYIRGYERLPIGVIYAKWSDPQNCYFICIGTPRHTYTEFREGHESLRLIEWLESIEESEQEKIINKIMEESRGYKYYDPEDDRFMKDKFINYINSQYLLIKR